MTMMKISKALTAKNESIDYLPQKLTVNHLKFYNYFTMTSLMSKKTFYNLKIFHKIIVDYLETNILKIILIVQCDYLTDRFFLIFYTVFIFIKKYFYKIIACIHTNLVNNI